MRHRLVLLAIVTILLSLATANAQEKTSRSRNAELRGLDVARAVEETRAGYSSASPEVVAKVQAAYAENKKESSSNNDRRLTGTWYVTVPIDALTTFYAFHTFGSDGTFVETSSLLGTLVEGPAHGVWEPRRRGGVLTFHVFEFDPDGNHVGRVRVRNVIRLTDENHLTAYGVVDFIDLNGQITEGIATGTFTAERIQVVAP